VSHKVFLNFQRGIVSFEPGPVAVPERVPAHLAEEEVRLRKIIALRYPIKLPEFEIALNTGMRRSEQYTYINWACVDFQRRDLFVPESKSGKSRHIPLNVPALAAFEALHEATGGQDPIFASRNGRESLRGPRHWFDGAIAEAKLNGFTWHDLRHTFASRLVMTGTDLRTVAELMGHRTIQMSMRYAHLAPEHKQAAVDRLTAFSPKSQKKSTDTKTSTRRKRNSKKASDKSTKSSINVLFE